MDNNDQNILRWAALLHDMQKRQTDWFEGRDHVHPFVSAAKALEVFKNIGFLDQELRAARGSQAQVKQDSLDKVL